MRTKCLYEKNSYIENEFLSLPNAINFIYNFHYGLKDNFNINEPHGRYKLYAWWVECGQKDYPCFTWELNDADKHYLFSFDNEKLPNALMHYAQERNDLRSFIEDPAKKYQYLFWWITDGKNEPFVGYTSQFIYDLKLNDKLPTHLYLLWQVKSDIQEKFDIQNKEKINEFIAWWKNEGIKIYPALSHNINAEKNSTHPTELENVKSKGINVIGFAEYTLGLGEDARTMISALKMAGFESGSIRPHFKPIQEPTMPLKNSLSDEKFSISIFCMPAIEMVRLALQDERNLINSDTYKIGWWPWELPKWPEKFSYVGNMVDEIWAQSNYVFEAYQTLQKHNSITIRHVPPVVEIPMPTENIRKKYDLKEDTFLFYLLFDGNSWLSRKNPLAGVMAFQKAFPKKEKNVGLIIKAMNIKPQDNMWQEILKISQQDDRIKIITETFSRQMIINFMHSCDAYISLHRSEGFGRVIAEAMLLGQPTIVSNYSGNTDFCNEKTSFLVDGKLIPLKKNDYIFPEEQKWFEADIDAAVKCLLDVFENRKKTFEIAQNAKKMIQEKFSIQAVSDIYKIILDKIIAK